MKTKVLLVILILIAVMANGQARFDKGYFIDHQNARVECLIKNVARAKTPAEFSYKLSESGVLFVAQPKDVNEFGIYDGNRFISSEVMIDASSDDEQNPSDEKNPVWSKQLVFLAVLVDGEATLYHYKIPGMERFFFKVGNTSIQQLVYKRFRIEMNHQYQMGTNNLFRNQILSAMYGISINVTTVDKLTYDLDDLSRLFIDYNKEKNSGYSVYHRKRENGAFHLRITPGLNITSVAVDNSLIALVDFDFGTQAGFRIGIEPELIFPYTHKSLALVLEPTFQYFSGSKVSGNQKMIAKLYTVEFPIGLRYYIHTKKSLTFFVNAFFIAGPTLHPIRTFTMKVRRSRVSI